MSGAAQDHRLRNRSQQGDLGEASAIEWFTRLGYVVYVPLGHSPDVDLIAELDGRLLRIQAKTSTQASHTPNGDLRSTVMLSTCGGNQSWNRVAKVIDPNRFDYLFAVTGDGRRWCIPAAALDAARSIALGGRKYSEFEIDACAPIRPLVLAQDGPLDSPAEPGEYPRGQRTAAVNRLASPSQVRLLPPPSSPGKAPFRHTRFERKLGQSGRAVINQKRRVTLPQATVAAAGLCDGDRLAARAVGDGQVLLERVEVPYPTSSADLQPPLTPPAATAPEEGA